MDTFCRLLRDVSSAISRSAQSLTEDESDAIGTTECTIGILKLGASEIGASALSIAVCSTWIPTPVDMLAGKQLSDANVGTALAEDWDVG